MMAEKVEKKIRSVRHLEKTCDNCGTQFSIMEESHPTKDVGQIKCSNCGFKIHEWNGGRICFLRQLAGPTKKNYRIFEFNKECENCGSIYKISETPVVSREVGVLKCEHCEAPVHEYKGGNRCAMKEQSGPTKPFKKFGEESEESNEAAPEEEQSAY